MVLLVKDIPQALTGSTKSWGQMLYAGSLALWMSHELDEDSRQREYTEAPIYHLPVFLLDAEFTGDAYFPMQDYPQFGSAPLLAPQGVRTFCPLPSWEQHTELQDPNLWPETPSKDTSSRTSMAAPPWPCYNQQYYRPKPLPPTFEGRLDAPRRLHHTPPTRPSSTLEHSLRSPIFHVPTAEEIAAHLDAAEELCRQRALETQFQPALESPFPRVFVPSPPLNNSPSSEPVHPSSPTPRDRSHTPFRIIPSLPVRFPMLFGPDVEFEAEDADVSDGTFSDIDMLTDSEGDECSCDEDTLGTEADGEREDGDMEDCVDEWINDEEDADDEAEVFFDAESELEI